MVTSVALLMLMVGSARPADCGPTKAGAPTTLVVQVVDELWLPLPGATVSARLQSDGTGCVKAVADVEGNARLAVPKQGTYTIESSMVGFKTKRLKGVGVDADVSKSVPHVQMKLKVASSDVTI